MRLALAGLGLLACAGPPPERVAGLTVDLITPADVDPLLGADTLRFRVLDGAGREIERAEGAIGSGVEVPLITTFGRVEIEVTARAGEQVVAAARTGPIVVGPGDEHTLDALLLPVNEAVRLRWTPSRDRVAHVGLPASDGRVLMVGGRAPSAADHYRDAEWWDPRVGYGGAGPRLPEGQSGMATARLDGRTWLVVGGETGGGASDQVVAIDVDEGVARDLGALARPQRQACLTPHPSLGALVFGEGPVEVWTGLGRVGSDLDFDGSGVAACATAGSRVVTAGDADLGWGVLDLDNATWPVRLIDRWTAVDDVPSLVGPAAVALDDDRVWVGGGFGFAASDVVRIIDPADATARRAEPLARPRVHAQAAPWRDGRVVLAGGYRDDVRSQAERSVEIHDPDEGSLLVVPLPLSRPTLTVLPGGTLLLTGGLDDDLDPGGAWAIVPWLDTE